MMAYVNVAHSVDGTLRERFSSFFAGLRESRLRRRLYKQTLRELSTLSERELNDLGLHRSMISTVAMQAAYGK